MALETLKYVTEIGGFKVIRDKPEGIDWETFDRMRDKHPINICDKLNSISFKIQKGPINEVGINGCQVDTLIHAAHEIIEELNFKNPCRENALALTKLEEALMWLEARTKDRVVRG